MQTTFNLDLGKDFSLELDKFKELLKSDYISLISAWENLKDSWNDPQFDSFEIEFEKIQSILDESQREIESQLQYIREQIDIVEKSQSTLNQLRR